jgi:hypothetical protein
LEKLFDTIKKRLLEETEFGIREISSIGYFIKEYVDEIGSFFKKKAIFEYIMQ